MDTIPDHAADTLPPPQAPVPFVKRLVYSQCFSLGVVLSKMALIIALVVVLHPHHPIAPFIWWLGGAAVVVSGLIQGIIAYRTPAGPSANIPRSALKAFWFGICIPVMLSSRSGPFAAKSTPAPKQSRRRGAE